MDEHQFVELVLKYCASFKRVRQNLTHTWKIFLKISASGKEKDSENHMTPFLKTETFPYFVCLCTYVYVYVGLFVITEYEGN